MIFFLDISAKWDHIERYKDLNLRALRLCFQVIAVKEGRVLGCVVTTPIFDKKVIQPLKILTMSIDKGSTKGGDELIILCDKVRDNDLVVRVFEKDQRGTILWMKEVRAPDVKIHKQTSLVLNTPMYRNPAVDTPRDCFIQLFRPSNGTTSEAKPFQYLPSKESKCRNLNNFISCTIDSVLNIMKSLSMHFRYPFATKETTENA